MAMDDVLTFLGAAVPALVLLAIGILLLRRLGPTDWSLFRRLPDPPWPHGVQEEEPRPWDFSGADPDDPPSVPADPEDGGRPS
jgi:hypothetical protein